MIAKLRHLAAGALVLCVAVCITPVVARAQADSAFDGTWEEAVASIGPVLTRHVYYGNSTGLGARLGLAVRVGTRAVVRATGQGTLALGNETPCVTDTFFSGAHAACGTELGTLWGGSIAVGYLDSDAAGIPETIVSLAPGVFNVTGSYDGTSATAFGLAATVEHRLSKGRSAAAIIGVGVRALLNVHHDTILEVPVELGGWSW